MGKGDKKTRRGKIFKGSYGVRRPKKRVKQDVLVTNTPETKTIKESGKITESTSETVTKKKPVKKKTEKKE